MEEGWGDEEGRRGWDSSLAGQRAGDPDHRGLDQQRGRTLPLQRKGTTEASRDKEVPASSLLACVGSDFMTLPAPALGGSVLGSQSREPGVVSCSFTPLYRCAGVA